MKQNCEYVKLFYLKEIFFNLINLKNIIYFFLKYF